MMLADGASAAASHRAYAAPDGRTGLGPGRWFVWHVRTRELGRDPRIVPPGPIAAKRHLHPRCR